MFRKILIANRGEIACRVIKTAKRMGIQTVAVYSEADANSRHVRLADEAVCIGPAAAKESYLVIEHIIRAAQVTGAQAIHPGYGFLSENEAFCEACDKAGIVFIGPPVAAIHAMGSKSAAKSLMAEAHVPLTPGYHGDNQDPDYLKIQADDIGYPVLIKASAGGGGKGMRLVERAEDFKEALASCQREAVSAFGDQQVLVEKYLVRPRHIEIQVFGDQHQNYVYLFERDCSVQRRHQKVLEEAPAPHMDEQRRAAMGKAAVDAARAVGYVGAGTVEFIVNQDGTFYFMEMNTRLQVEHPVTEMITGLDLVEWQLRVAAGEPLPLKQEQLAIQGHAIEARIYAEDPDKGFLPSTGKLIHLRPPADTAHVRVDTGVEQGDAISPFYDPMIAKLIVWDKDRERALARMHQALAAYQVVGVANNIPFLLRLIATQSFAQADLDTSLIEREQASLFPEAQAIAAKPLFIAALAELSKQQHAAMQVAKQSAEPVSPWNSANAWRVNLPAQRELKFRFGDTLKTVQVTYTQQGYTLVVDDQQSAASVIAWDQGALTLVLDGSRIAATVVDLHQERHLFADEQVWVVHYVDPLQIVAEGAALQGGLIAPMPGKVIALLAEPNSQVEKGTPLLILEAMKMEHTIRAPAAGLLKAYRFAVGDQVSDGADFVEFEAIKA